MAELTFVIKYFTVVLLIGLLSTTTALSQQNSISSTEATTVTSTQKSTTSTEATTVTSTQNSTTPLCVTTQEQGNVIGRRKRNTQQKDDDPDCINTTEKTTSSSGITQQSSYDTATDTTNTNLPEGSAVMSSSVLTIQASLTSNGISPTSATVESQTEESKPKPTLETTEQITNTKGVTAVVESSVGHTQTLEITEGSNDHSTSHPTESSRGSTTLTASSSTTNKSGRNDKNTSSNEQPYDHELAIIFGVMLGLMLLAIFIFCVHRCYKREKQETMRTGGGDISIKMSTF